MRTFAVHDRSMPAIILLVVADRWVDAREVARAFFGSPDAEAMLLPDDVEPESYVEAKWFGSAARSPSDLQLMVRYVDVVKRTGWRRASEARSFLRRATRRSLSEVDQASGAASCSDPTLLCSVIEEAGT